MILVYTGRRDVPAHGAVAEAVRELLVRLAPRLAVGSAAAGADLVVLREAVQMGLHVRVVLRGEPDEFARASVGDKGQEWVDLFTAVLAAQQVTATVLDVPATDAGYEAVNRLVIDTAADLAGDGEEIVVLAVTSPEAPGGAHTEGLAAGGERRGWPVIRIPVSLK